MLAADLDEGLVGALHDALRADIDPRARGHLAVHHQALAIELVEIVESRPMRYDVGIGDQDARRVRMGRKCRPACRTARTGSRRLPALPATRRCGHSFPSRARHARCHHRPRARAASRPLPDRDCSSACASVLRLPAFAGHHRAARAADDAVIVETLGHDEPSAFERRAVWRRLVASINAPLVTISVAVAMSGAIFRSASSLRTCLRSSARALLQRGLDVSGA